MVFTKTGTEGTALRIGSDTAFLQFTGIGTGSTVAASGNDTNLSTETGARIVFTTKDFSSLGSFTFSTFYNSFALSGATITEFASFVGSEGGSCWTRDNFTPGITFDGQQEMEIDVTINAF